MSSQPSFDIARAWYRFLVELELGRNHARPAILSGGIPESNPLVDAILPALLYIKLASLVDEILAEHLDVIGELLPKGYNKNLGGRIRFCKDKSFLSDAGKLISLASKRNELAHESDAECTWAELDDSADAVQAELEHFGLVGPRPSFAYFGERYQVPPNGPGIMATMEYRYGVKEGDRVVAEFRRQKNMYMPGHGPQRGGS